jgi:SAM-dependent methyltransferase
MLQSDPSSALPIAAMPIIALGKAQRGDESVEVASTGVRRSSMPPGTQPGAPQDGRHPFTELEDEVTPARTRAPADSLVQAIPSPRAPLQSDPAVERPSYGRGLAAPSTSTTENGAAVAVMVPPAEPVSGTEMIPDDLVDSEHEEGHVATEEEQTAIAEIEEPVEEIAEPAEEIAEPVEEIEEHAEEIEPEPDSEPGENQPSAEPPVRAVAEASKPAVEPTAKATAAEPEQDVPEDRSSENPPEVDPDDVEIHETAGLAKPPPVRMPLPLPLYARGAELAAAVQAQQASETPAGKRARYWWDEMFGDDFLRTMDRLTDSQIKTEVNFIEESLGVQKGGIILDLACGAGRHAVELGVRGYNVVGYDLSLAMLARAADEAQDKNQKLNFLHGDMRDMGFEEMFDGVYCWSTSFGYFDDEKNQLVAQKIHRALRSGGMLLLDVANRDFVAQRQPSLVWFEGEGCVCMDEMRVDFITSRLRVKRMVILDDGRTRELDYSIRLYTLHELGRMLHDVGFKVTEVSGHPATPGVFMGADSPRLIVLAEKA